MRLRRYRDRASWSQVFIVVLVTLAKMSPMAAALQQPCCPMSPRVYMFQNSEPENMLVNAMAISMPFLMTGMTRLYGHCTEHQDSVAGVVKFSAVYGKHLVLCSVSCRPRDNTCQTSDFDA